MHERSKRLLRVVFAATAITATGCDLVLGLGKYTEGGGANGGASSTSTGPGGPSTTTGSASCTDGAMPCNGPNQCPAQASLCMTNTCIAGCCGTKPAAMGTMCSDGGGQVCDAMGTCIGCNSKADCGGYCVMGKCNNPVAVAVPGGISHTCAILSDGTLWCWGTNTLGQLGDGTMNPQASPTKVMLPSAAKSVSANGRIGLGSFAAETCAVLVDGSLYCWGGNTAGQLGVGDTSPHVGPQHVVVPGMPNIKFNKVAVGGYSVCAIDSTNNLWCWGGGPIGDGSSSSVPIPTSIMPSVSAVALGTTHFCAIKMMTGANLVCWGDNTYGELGTNTTSANPVLTPSTSPYIPYNMVEVSAGNGFTCARNGVGIYCWGNNPQGQLGIGSTMNQPMPTPLSLPNAKLGATGFATAGAITPTGLFMWGNNSAGQLGDGTAVSHSSPENIMFPNATDLSLMGLGSCALTTNGKLMCWGGGALGNGTMNASSTPVQAVWP